MEQSSILALPPHHPARVRIGSISHIRPVLGRSADADNADADADSAD